MKRISFHVVLLLLALTGVSHAQWDDVRNIYFDTISGEFEPLMVAVEDMKPASGLPMTQDDSLQMVYATRVIQRDVDFYADFELVPYDSFFIKTYELTEIGLLGWRRLGARYVVRLFGEFPEDRMHVKWEVWDAQDQRQIGDGNFTYHRQFWRELAHDVSNQIVRRLTGDPGIFRTKIVYIKDVGDSAKELFMADYDGANERQITKTGTINVSPAFHPDLEHVYFTSYMTGEPQLFVVDINTSKVERVGSHEGSVTAPSVSPDGKKIAVAMSTDGNYEIYVLDLTGRVIKRITRSRAIESAPTWSPDSKYICFSSDRTGTPQLYITDSDGIETRRLTYQGSYNDSPVWSDRGDRITFVTRTPRGRFDLASIDTSGTDFRVLTHLGHNENPHFSPDGKHIIFRSTRLSEGDIYTMDVSGRNQRRVTRNGKSSNPAWGPLK